MNKNIINVIAGVVIIVGIVLAIIFLKPTSLVSKIEFKLPFAAMSEFEIRDIEKIDYSTDEERLKPFLSEFFTFLTEEYEYSSNPEDPLKKRINFYFTQEAEEAYDNYEYKSDYYEVAHSQVLQRNIFLDTSQIMDMKIESDPIIKVISKNAEKLKYVNEDGNRYNVLYYADISRNKKVSENGVFRNYGGERVIAGCYLEIEVYEYLGEFKIHNIINRGSKEGVVVFKEYFTEKNSGLYSFDEMVSQISYSKDNSTIRKYANSEAKSIDTKYVSSLKEDEIKRIVNNNINEVVIINNLNESGMMNSIGSGIFIKPGIILTNWHVIDGAEQLKILTHGGEEWEVDGIISANDKIDLAIIKLKKEIGKGVTFSSMQNLSNSSPVVAIGHPLGNLYTITVGGYDKKIINQGVDFLQSQIPLLPGNSGGPLLDKDGNVIGINTAITAGDTTLTLPYKYIDNVLEALEKYNFSEIEVYKY